MRRSATRAVLLSSCLAFAAVRCSTPNPPAALAEVPYPDLSHLEKQVQEQLEPARARLLALRASSDGDRKHTSEVYGAVGMLYQAYGLLQPAEACHRNAQALDPGEFRWPYYLAHVLRAEGKPELARASFERALEIDPRRVPAIIHLAELELDAGQIERAEGLFTRAKEIEPTSVQALTGLGKTASARREYRVAVGHFEQALRLAPYATDINYPLGLAYRNLGEVEKAQATLEKHGRRGASLNDPLMQELESLAGGWRVHQNRGTALFREGLHARALEEFKKALESAPDEPLLHLNVGSALTLLGDAAGAKAAFEEAIRLDPQMALAHFNLGTLSAQMGRDPEAVQHYEAALSADAGHVKAHFNLANALRRLGRPAEAIEHYERVLDMDPRNSQARLGEALALARLGRYQQAAARLEEGLKVVPEDRPLRNALVRILAAAPEPGVRNGPRALTLAQALVTEESSLPHVVGLAMAAAASGRFDLALEWQEKAVQAVRSAGRPELLPALEEDLGRYRRRQTSRAPWPEDDPSF